MKSIKPGRGPSMLGGIAGIGVAIFGVFWTIMAVQMGAPIFFAAFGVIFVIIAISGVIYNLRNATGEKRFSTFDIVDEEEEPDPLNERFGQQARSKCPNEDETWTAPKQKSSEKSVIDGENSFCPYCGAPVKETYTFCRKCGRRLDESAE